MTSDAVLVTDPVFQLNVLLWALEDLPEVIAVRPVLCMAGYELESLGRGLLVAADEPTVSALRDIAGSTERTSRPQSTKRRCSSMTSETSTPLSDSSRLQVEVPRDGPA